MNRVIDRGLGGWRELLFLRLTFPAIYNLLSYAAGSTRLPFRQYLAVTAFGGIIHTSILALGASIAPSMRCAWWRTLGSQCCSCWRCSERGVCEAFSP